MDGPESDRDARSRRQRELPFLPLWRNAVRDCRELKATEKCVLFTFSTYASREGRAYPSARTLARGAGLSEGSRQSVYNALKHGKELGLLAGPYWEGKVAPTYQALLPAKEEHRPSLREVSFQDDSELSSHNDRGVSLQNTRGLAL